MRDTILALARKELGTVEFPPNSNKVKYNTAYYGRAVSGSAYPWCCVFLWWLFKQAGASKLFFDGKKTAYCPTLLAYYKQKGQLVSDYKPGDIVFFNFSGGKTAQHVGLCTAWDGTYITTIDGNTGSGNEANGGAVMERKRHKKYIVAVARPKYSGGGSAVEVSVEVLKKGSKGASVKALQILLNGYGYSCGTVDGSFGPATLESVKKYQKEHKLAVDGICGPATWLSLLGR